MSKINEKFVKVILGIGSQQVLAKECGVSQQIVSLWENGCKTHSCHYQGHKRRSKTRRPPL